MDEMRRPVPAMNVGIGGMTTLELARRWGIAVGQRRTFSMGVWVQVRLGRHEGLEVYRRLLRSTVVKVSGGAVERMVVVVVRSRVDWSVHGPNAK